VALAIFDLDNTLIAVDSDHGWGEFLVAEGSFAYIDKLLQSFEPNEVLYQRNKKKIFRRKLWH
jgi:DNA mismatch repair protein MutS